jgi:CBS domain-containing protein
MPKLASPELRLWADTAAELMMPNPVSIRDNALLKEALVLLTTKGFSAAPVIDAAGRPVGVLSRSDIIVHDREKVDYVPSSEFFHNEEVRTADGEKLGHGFQVENVDKTRVRDLMTPAVFSVSPGTPAAKVINEMLGLHVHRLFVVDDNGVLIGVISALDVLRHLRP